MLKNKEENDLIFEYNLDECMLYLNCITEYEGSCRVYLSMIKFAQQKIN